MFMLRFIRICRFSSAEYRESAFLKQIPSKALYIEPKRLDVEICKLCRKKN